ncbi:hypothetical protein ACQCSU_09475 [Pseudarthrobacter sp. O4]|uniref:hypothetical protein n=1 Tax=Pseudarthrobacter sp. O4 TaxID=3418417 RepID=UPI003CF1FB09
MTTVGGAFGPILEVMTWVGFVLGLPLLAWGWIAIRRHCQWTQTTAQVFSAGGFKGYHWTDHQNADHRSLLPDAESPGLADGADVVLYYDVCHPSRWGLAPPKPDNPAWTLGWVLTGVGAISTALGFVLLFL